MYEQEINTLHEKRKKAPWIRDEIEDIVKEENIDRNRFHEFSKSSYIDIIRKFYFTFSDRKHYKPSQIHLSLCYMHFRKNLEQNHIDCFFRTNDWTEYMVTIINAVPEKNIKLFLIIEYGWVYEGYADEIFNVIDNISCNYDFYIVSSKYDWFIAVSNMEDSATMYRNKF